MNQYSLLKAGRDWKTRKKGTHLDSLLTALKALDGKANVEQLTKFCDQRRMFRNSEMDTAEALRWVAAYAVRLGLLSAKEYQEGRKAQ